MFIALLAHHSMYVHPSTIALKHLWNHSVKLNETQQEASLHNLQKDTKASQLTYNNKMANSQLYFRFHLLNISFVKVFT